MPARVKSGGKPEPIRRPRRETRMVWPRLDSLKPNPQRLIKRPTATSARRRCASDADHKVWWSARPSGAAIGDVNPIHGMSGRPNPYSIRDMMTKHEIAYRVRVPRGAAPWRRRPRSSRRAGKPPTRRRGSGSPAYRPWRYTTCGSPKAALDVAEWLPESRALGNLYTRFGGGRRRRGCEATAPTAHPTYDRDPEPELREPPASPPGGSMGRRHGRVPRDRSPGNSARLAILGDPSCRRRRRSRFAASRPLVAQHLGSNS